MAPHCPECGRFRPTWIHVVECARRKREREIIEDAWRRQQEKEKGERDGDR